MAISVERMCRKYGLPFDSDVEASFYGHMVSELEDTGKAPDFMKLDFASLYPSWATDEQNVIGSAAGPNTLEGKSHYGPEEDGIVIASWASWSDAKKIKIVGAFNKAMPPARGEEPLTVENAIDNPKFRETCYAVGWVDWRYVFWNATEGMEPGRSFDEFHKMALVYRADWENYGFVRWWLRDFQIDEHYKLERSFVRYGHPHKPFLEVTPRSDGHISVNLGFYELYEKEILVRVPSQHEVAANALFMKRHGLSPEQLEEKIKDICKKHYILYLSGNLEDEYSQLRTKMHELFFVRPHEFEPRFGVWKSGIVGAYLNSINNDKMKFDVFRRVMGKIGWLRKPSVLTEREMGRHVYILASPGSGKSELLKRLIYGTNQGIAKGRHSAVVLDPHGDVARELVDFSNTFEIAKLGRFFYVDPKRFDDAVFCINPFEIKNREDSLLVQSMAEQIASTFAALLKGEKDKTFSTNMQAVLIPCLHVLLRNDGMTLEDLQDFMDDEKNAHLVNLGKALPFARHAEFFHGSSGFFSESYKRTKQSLHTKLQTLLNSELFVKMTCGPSSVCFEDELDRGALFVFNLSKGVIGEDSAEAAGRFIVSTLAGIALAREHQDKSHRVPVYLYADEVQNFVSRDLEKILAEARKYKVFLVAANQTAGQDMDTQLRDMLLSSGVLFGGPNNATSVSTLARNMNVDAEEFTRLQLGEFLMYRRERQATEKVRVKMVSGYELERRGSTLERGIAAYTAYGSRRKPLLVNNGQRPKTVPQEAILPSAGPRFSR